MLSSFPNSPSLGQARDILEIRTSEGCHIHRIVTLEPQDGLRRGGGIRSMLNPESQDYFRRRERAERAAAKNAVTEASRRIHQELAQGYAMLLRNPKNMITPPSVSR